MRIFPDDLHVWIASVLLVEAAKSLLEADVACRTR
jgi:hypothetical protein